MARSLPDRADRLRRAGGVLAAAAWPLLFFGDRIVPYRGTVRAVGNDFPFLYYAYKAYLLDCLANGHLPLWSPAEAAGFPFFSNPFTQAFYPLNAVLLAFRAWTGGYSTYDHQVFTILGVSGFAVGLYAWLRSLRVDVVPALFGACVASTGFRIADIMRLPNAVHSAVWYPWILLALNRLLTAGRRAEVARWSLVLVACGTALVTAGYPYYAYYSLFLIGPYLLLAPRVAGPPPPGRARPWRWLVTLAAAGVVTFVLCSPYLLKVAETLAATVRKGDDLDFSLTFGSGWTDSLFSLVYPLAANPDGCYYVGTLGLLLVALYVREVWTSPSAIGPGRGVVGAVLAWIALVNYVSWGRQSALFVLLWHWLPGFSWLRAWGRLNVVLLPLLAWLLALSFAQLQGRLRRLAEGAEPGGRGWWLTLAASALLVGGLQVGAWTVGRVHGYYRDLMPELAGGGGFTLVGGALAFLVLGTLFALARRRASLPPGALLALLLLATALDVWPLASRLWTYRGPLPSREPFDVASVLRRSLEVPRQKTVGTISMSFAFDRPRTTFSPSLNVAVVPECYFQRYWDFLALHQAEPTAVERLLGLKDGRRLLLSAHLDHPDLASFFRDIDGFDGSVSVRGYDGDRLEAGVRLTQPGHLTFVDNWDRDWRAYVDGRPVPLEVAFGTFKAVAVPDGEHEVSFRYQPWSLR